MVKLTPQYLKEYPRSLYSIEWQHETEERNREKINIHDYYVRSIIENKMKLNFRKSNWINFANNGKKLFYLMKYVSFYQINCCHLKNLLVCVYLHLKPMEIFSQNRLAWVFLLSKVKDINPNINFLNWKRSSFRTGKFELIFFSSTKLLDDVCSKQVVVFKSGKLRFFYIFFQVIIYLKLALENASTILIDLNM